MLLWRPTGYVLEGEGFLGGGGVSGGVVERGEGLGGSPASRGSQHRLSVGSTDNETKSQPDFNR